MEGQFFPLQFVDLLAHFKDEIKPSPQAITQPVEEAHVNTQFAKLLIKPAHFRYITKHSTWF